MKNFKSYAAEKYSAPEYKQVEEGIYFTKDSDGDEIYVTSLSFEPEPSSYGEEGGSPQNITQCPLEDILDEFLVYVTDFYDELNAKSDVICYQEFGSANIEDIRNLRSIIGKRVYAVPYTENGEEYYDLKIE